MPCCASAAWLAHLLPETQMRHDLLTLELLLAVARTRSITRGAEQVHLALAAASKRVSDLEARLGVRLFLRQARGVDPTPACRSLLRHVRTVTEGLQAFDLAAAEFSGGMKGQARVLVAKDASATSLPGALSNFASKYPDVQVVLTDVCASEVEESISRGNADIGIFMRPVQGTSLQAWPLASGRWVVIVPAGHVLQSRARVSFNDLLAFELIGNDRLSSLMTLMERAAPSSQGRFKPRISSASLDSVAALVEAGAGIAVVPDVAAGLYAGMRRIRAIPLTDDWADYELIVGVAQKNPMPILIERLVKAVRSSMPSLESAAKAA